MIKMNDRDKVVQFAWRSQNRLPRRNTNGTAHGARLYEVPARTGEAAKVEKVWGITVLFSHCRLNIGVAAHFSLTERIEITENTFRKGGSRDPVFPVILYMKRVE